MRLDRTIKLFAMSNQMLENDLDRVERELAIDLRRGHLSTIEKDPTYYPQIDGAIRQEAAAMSQHYEVLYSLERSIRSLVEETLVTADGEAWWTTARVPSKIKQEAEARL